MKIVISGNYGAKNIGDELILQGLLTSAEKIFKTPEITVLSGAPTETAEKYNINSVEKVPAGFRSALKALFIDKCATRKIIKNCDLFVMGGGGLFGGVEKKANIIWGIQALAPIIYRKPMIMVGQSIGKIDNRVIKFIIKNVFKRARAISVRDVNSKKILKRIGVRGKIHVVPDSAFRLKNCKSIKVNKDKCIIVALRQMQELPKDFIKNISNFLKFVHKKEGWKIIFIDFQSGKMGDSIIHEKIKKNFFDSKKLIHIKKIENTTELFELYAKADFCLGMRLHSIITSIITETPFLALNYAPKISGVVNMAKFNEYILPLEKANSALINKKFQKIIKNKTKISSELKAYAKKAYNRHMEAENCIIKKSNNSSSEFFQCR